MERMTNAEPPFFLTQIYTNLYFKLITITIHVPSTNLQPHENLFVELAMCGEAPTGVSL